MTTATIISKKTVKRLVKRIGVKMPRLGYIMTLEENTRNGITHYGHTECEYELRADKAFRNKHSDILED